MTSTRSRSVAVAVAALAGAACWSALILGGLDVARWCAAGCPALVTVVALWRLPRTAEPRPRERRDDDGLTPRAYPRFHELASTVQRALQDRRYHDRVFAPLVRQIAADLHPAATPAWLRARVGDQAWQLLDPDRPPASGAPGEPPPPTAAELGTLMGRLEQLDDTWR